MGNRSSSPAADRQYSNCSPADPNRRASTQGYYDPSPIYNVSDSTNAREPRRKSSLSFEPQLNNILLSIDRDVVKPSSYKKSSGKKKSRIKLIAALSRSKTSSKPVGTVDASDIRPSVSDITAVTSHSSNKTEFSVITNRNHKLVQGLKRNQSKETVNRQPRVSSESSALNLDHHNPCALDPHTVKADIKPSTENVEHDSHRDMIHANGKVSRNRSHHIDYHTVVDNNLNTYDDYTQGLLKHSLHKTSTYTDHNHGTTISTKEPGHENPPLTAVRLDHTLKVTSNYDEKQEKLDESGLDQSILDLIHKNSDSNYDIQISPRPIFKDDKVVVCSDAQKTNLLPMMSDEDSTVHSDFMFDVNNTTLLSMEQCITSHLHDIKPPMESIHFHHKEGVVKGINQGHDCNGTTQSVYTENEYDEPAFTNQAMYNASFLFSLESSRETSIPTKGMGPSSVESIHRRLSHINVEESRKRLSGDKNVAEMYVNDILLKAKENEEKRRLGMIPRKIPIFRVVSVDAILPNIQVETRKSSEVVFSRTLSEMSSQTYLSKESQAECSVKSFEESSSPIIEVVQAQAKDSSPRESSPISNTKPFDETNLPVQDYVQDKDLNPIVPVCDEHEQQSTQSSNEDDEAVIDDMSHSNICVTECSPFTRFKSAMKQFEEHPMNLDSGDTRQENSPTRAMLCSNGFVVNKVTELNGRLRRNIQRPLKEERRLTVGTNVIAPRRAKLVHPLFRANENRTYMHAELEQIVGNKESNVEPSHETTEFDKISIESETKVSKTELPHEITCEAIGEDMNEYERRVTICSERLVDKVPNHCDCYPVDVADLVDMHDAIITAADICKLASEEEVIIDPIKVILNQDYDSVKISYTDQLRTTNNDPNDTSGSHEFENIKQPVFNAKSDPDFKEELSIKGDTHVDQIETTTTTTSYQQVLDKENLLPSLSDMIPLHYEKQSENWTTIEDVPKLVRWSIEDLRTEEENKMIDSPVETILSLCSLSPNIVGNNYEERCDQGRSNMTPSALCLSPIQRTPMQARKWRTLAAQAEAKKKSVHKNKSTSKVRKSIGLRPKGYLDV